MKNYIIRRYEPQDFAIWNAFVSTAKNATFLFQRDFMEYHSDRFQDFSLMVFEGETLVSVIPANKVGNVVYSHQGLTYGGFVFQEKIKLPEVISIAKCVLQFLHENQIHTFQIKLLPSIYTTAFSEELKYALFLTDAKLIRRDCLSVIDLSKPFNYSTIRKRGVLKGLKNNLDIREELNFELFWKEILIPNLDKKFNVQPVHTFEEMARLQQKFPENIRHFNVYHENKIVAGTTVFVAGNVVHCQYISGNETKSEFGSLDFLHNHLIAGVFNDKHFFDFGISNENNGRNINEGLLYWKESFGARTVTQDFYEVKTVDFQLLDNVLI